MTTPGVEETRMGKIDLVDLQGAPYIRGKAFGTERRVHIERCLSDWLGSLKHAGVGNPQAYLADMLRVTSFAQSIQDHAPDLLEEVRGMADGAGQSFELLLTAQLMDEEWAHRAGLSADAQRPEKCSSVAVRTQNDAILIGQNMDLGGYTDGHQVVLRIAPGAEEPGALIFSISSMIALFGVNSHRIGVCVNSVPQLPARRRGLPVAFMIRKLLQARTLNEAVETVTSVPHATGQHYLIADEREIRSFEASPAGVEEYRSHDPAGVLHTNHPLVDSLVDPAGSYVNSETRLQCLRRRLSTDRPDLEAVKAALASRDDPNHPVSRTLNSSATASPTTGMISFTTGSMVSVLTQDSNEIEAWVSPGPPSIHGYSRLSMKAS